MQSFTYPEAAVTLDNLTGQGYLVVYGTADVWTVEAIGHGDTDRKGWVSSLDQPDEPVENRNDVKPLFAASLPLNEDQVDDLRHLVGQLGAVHDDGNTGSTLYASDAKTYDLTTDETWMYAIHSHVKHYDAVKGEWAETPVALLK